MALVPPEAIGTVERAIVAAPPRAKRPAVTVIGEVAEIVPVATLATPPFEEA